MLRIVVTAITILASANAWAQTAAEPEPDHRVGFSIHLGGISNVSGDEALELEGAWRHGGDTWLRVAIAGGVPLPHESGRVLEARLGVERRRQDCGRGCFYTGLDLAVVAADAHDEPDDLNTRALFAIGRGGIDAGSDMLRFRLGIEVWLGAGRVHDLEPDHMPPIDATTTRFLPGFAFTTGVSAQF
jgi:hypothetical protein